MVEDGGDGTGLPDICVNALPQGGGAEAGTQTDAGGGYAIGELPAGDYRLQFVACDVGGGSRGSHVTEYFDDAPTFSDADPVTLDADETFTADASLAVAGEIEGVVTSADDGSALSGICVRTDPDHGDGFAETDESGSYSIRGLAEGEYTVSFSGCSVRNFLPQWFSGASSAETATPVNVAAGSPAINVDAALEPGATISGTLTSEQTDAPLDGACAFAYGGDGNGPPLTSTVAADGNYELVGLPAGSYWVRFAGCGGNYVAEYYEESRTLQEATPVTVSAGDAATGIDGALGPGGTISGTATNGLGVGASDVCVDARLPGSGETIARERTDFDGLYVLTGLPTGNYVIRFEDCGSGDRYAFQYYPGLPNRSVAVPVSVTVGEAQTGIDAQMAPQATIQGTVVTAPDGPLDESPPEERVLEGVCVNAFEEVSGDPAGSTATGPEGTYTLTGLANGDYRVQFDPGCDDLDYATEFYDSSEEADAEIVSTTALASATGIDAVVEPQNNGPRVSISTGPPPSTRNVNPFFTFTIGDSATEVECSLVPAAQAPVFGDCSAVGSHQSATLTEGPYEFTVRAADALGVANEATRLFTVDITPPVLEMDSPVIARSNETSPNFTFTAEPGTTVRCSIQPGTALSLGPCSGSGAHAPATPLPDGNYTFAVRAIDTAGNATPLAFAFEVDTTGPALEITGGPQGSTSVARPSFEFSVPGAAETLTCSLTGATGLVDTRSCAGSSTYIPPSDLADGQYTFELAGTDDLENSTVVQRSFTVDTVAPVTQVTGGPPARTADARPEFEFSADEGSVTFTCSIHEDVTEVEAGACSDSFQPAAELDDGVYTFSVRATDAAGNLGAAAADWEFEVDRTPPAAAITEEPGSITNDPLPRFAFEPAGDAGTAECAIYAASETPAFADCLGDLTFQPASPLADGDYTFDLQVADALGNLVSEERAFTVDTQAPSLTVTTGPTGETADTRPSFNFDAEPGSTVECSVERAGQEGFGPCSGAASHRPAAALANGDYEFVVRATDQAGNSRSAARAFSVAAFVPPPGAPPSDPPPSDPPPADDPPPQFTPPVSPPADTTAPTVQITSGPKRKTKDSTPKFAFTSSDPAAEFTCKVDSGPEQACSSPFTSSKLKPGKHELTVVAADPAGNRSAPASQAFTVKKKKKKRRK